MALQAIITKIDALKAQIDALRPISPEQEQRIMQKFRLEWNYHSNAIEGNKLTYGETKAFLLHGITAKGKPFKDYLDIKGHNEAIQYLSDLVNQDAILTESDIRGLHKILLVEPYKSPAMTPSGLAAERWIKIGEYKTAPNHVQTQTGGIHYYASPEETPAMMGDLMQWYRRELEKADLHPVVFAATFHYRFVAIHPFDDGNGRMARLLMNLILMQKGYVPIVIKLEERARYYLALEKADSGELDEFVEMVGEELIHSMQIYLKGARGENIEEPDDFEKKVELLKQRLRVGEGIDQIHKNEQTYAAYYDTFIFPFLTTLSRHLTKIDTFFSTSSASLTTQTSQVGRSRPQPFPIDRLSENVVRAGREDHSLEKVSILIEWADFVKDKHAGMTLGLHFHFRKYQVEMEYQVNDHRSAGKAVSLLPISYGEPFSPERIQSLASEVATAALAKVEAMS